MVNKAEDDEPARSSAALRFDRDRFRRSLTRHLEMTEDEAFLNLIWNVRALQSGRANHVQRHLSFPDEAYTAELGKGNYLPPWDLELVANERLVARPFPMFASGPRKIVRCETFHAVAYAVHLARRVADCQIGLKLKQMDVFREMARIGHRQFEWQRGFSNGPQVYRWHFLFGGPKARALFEERHGLTIPDFTKLAFGLYALFGKHASGPAHVLPGQVELAEPIVKAGLAMLSAPIAEARANARAIRKSTLDINYQASQLRKTPVIIFAGGESLRAPLPELLLVRATEGLYYDLVGAHGDVRNEVADRFEDYTRDLLNAALPDRQAMPAPKYRWKGQPAAGPDVLLYDGPRLAVVIECKARKMNLNARFGEHYPGAEDGLAELAGGVFQLWKYVSHVRRGLIAESGLQPDTPLVVLTLDNWMTLSPKLQEDVLAQARSLAGAKDAEVTESDQRAVVFASIEDVELTLQNADGALFELLLERATQAERFTGTTLRGLLDENERLPHKPYPLGGRIGEVIPWLPIGGAETGSKTATR
jgi:hypothetical protein